MSTTNGTKADGTLHMTASIHVLSTTSIAADSGTRHDWLTIGRPECQASLFFRDDSDISRMIRQLEILRHRMRVRASLPVEEPETVEEVAHG